MTIANLEISKQLNRSSKKDTLFNRKKINSMEKLKLVPPIL